MPRLPSHSSLEHCSNENLGKTITKHLSITLYTHSHAGNYADHMAGYATSFCCKINKLMTVEHFVNVKKFRELDLAQHMAAGDYGIGPVWDVNKGEKETQTLEYLKIPMYFDPCAFLSSFAWCITRMRKAWSLCRLHIVELVYLACTQSSAVPFVWLTEELMTESPEHCKEQIAINGISKFYYDEMRQRSGRSSIAGGCVARHQVCLSFHPGMVGPNEQIFTDISQKRKNDEMILLDSLISGVSDPKSTTTGKIALETFRSNKVRFLGALNGLKVLPLAALVGLVDIEKCFRDVLYGECPKDKPHGKALVRLDCDTSHLEQKYIQGLNESYGMPQEYFFYGDHVLCMSEGLHLNPSKQKWDAFFRGMTLYRFEENEANCTIGIVAKEFGAKEWVHYKPHVWNNDITFT